MPSKTPAQARLMAAAAHTPGGYGGVPQSVGKEFNKADTGGSMLKGHKPIDMAYAAGGPVLGRTRDFLKTPDAFRTDKGDPQEYGKKGKGEQGKDKSLPAVKPRK